MDLKSVWVDQIENERNRFEITVTLEVPSETSVEAVAAVVELLSQLEE